jgi:hypothetical protein
MKRWGWVLWAILGVAPPLVLMAEVRGLPPIAGSGGVQDPLPTPTPSPSPTPQPDEFDLFYLRANGDGSAPETIAGAFDEADFNNVANWDTDEANDGLIGPGDRVVVLDDDGDLSGLTPQGSGTATAPITISGEGEADPIVDGAGTSPNALLIDGKSWLIVREIAFEGGSGGTSGVILITGAGSDSNIIRGNDIGNSTQNGILFAATAGASNEIRGNTIHDNEDNGINAAAHAGSTSDATRTVIVNNTIQANDQNGIRAEADFWTIEENTLLDNGSAGAFSGIASIGDDNLIRYNSITNQTGNGNDGSGISIVGSDNVAYYNLTFANDGPGISANDSPNVVLYNNVMHGDCQGAALTEKGELRLVASVADTTTATVKNNIADATAANAYAIYIDAEVSNNTLDITTNDWRATATNWYFFNATGGNVLATWNAIAAGIGTDLNDDPQFVTPGTDFDLQSDSTMIDAGTDVGLALDFSGQQILQPPDIGAYEGPPEIGTLVFQGGGWAARGHLGTPSLLPFDTCVVSTLANSGAGSLRTCVTETRSRPRLVTFSVGGEIVISTPIEIRQPYLTIDGFTAPSPGITVRNTQEATPPGGRNMAIIMEHDIILRGLRIVGPWPGPGDPGNPNFETFQNDGSGNKTVDAWDDSVEAANADIILDHMTFTQSQDDNGSLWCDTDRVTAQYNMYYMNYHPTTRGCNGWKAESNADSRRFISDIGNFYTTNGERTPLYREGTYRFDSINNIIHAWQDFGTLAGRGLQGAGMWFRDPPNYRHNIQGNVFLPDVSVGHTGAWRPNWDCFMAADPNAPVANDCRYWMGWFDDNLFSTAHNASKCVTHPANQAEVDFCTGQGFSGFTIVSGPFTRDYPLPTHIDPTNPANVTLIEALIDGAGMPYPNATELAHKARAKLKLRQRLGLE